MTLTTFEVVNKKSTMRFGLFVLAAAFLALKAQHASAFSPLSRGASSLDLKTTYQVSRGQTRLPTFAKSLSRIALAMGGMEDFITGRDDKARKAENDKYIAQLQKRVDKINGLEATIEELDDDELVAKTAEFQARLKKGEDINGPLLEEAYAVVREAAW